MKKPVFPRVGKNGGKSSNHWNFLPRLLCGGMLAVSLGLSAPLCEAAINVTVTGPGGSGNAVLPDAGGSFAVDIPLNRNAVNPLTITAADTNGNTRSANVSITQLSLGQIVVSRVTAERLSTEEVEQLVADGTLNLTNSGNYNVSNFAIVLTIDGQEVPISVPIVFPMGEPDPVGYETYQMPPGGNGGGGGPPPPTPPEIVVFLQEFTASDPGKPTPPPIPLPLPPMPPPRAMCNGRASI